MGSFLMPLVCRQLQIFHVFFNGVQGIQADSIGVHRQATDKKGVLALDDEMSVNAIKFYRDWMYMRYFVLLLCMR